MNVLSMIHLDKNPAERKRIEQNKLIYVLIGKKLKSNIDYEELFLFDVIFKAFLSLHLSNEFVNIQFLKHQFHQMSKKSMNDHFTTVLIFQKL